MRRHKGITLVEILIVISILGVLGAIVFVAAAPARENARQAICSNQMRQIYMAGQLYLDEWPYTPSIPGLENFPIYGWGTTCLMPYIRDESTFFCPDATASARRFRSSYSWIVEASILNTKENDMDGANRAFLKDLKTRGSLCPILRCQVHDEAFYMPREMNDDRNINNQFVLELRLDGSVKATRRKMLRTKLFNSP